MNLPADRLLMLLGFCMLGAAVLEAAEPLAVVADRVRAVIAMLAPRPAGFGRPISDRPAWERLAATGSYRNVVRDAGKLLAEPLPDSPDDLYLDYSRTGNRTRWQSVAGLRRGRIERLTLAECLENKGRFLPALEAALDAICEERTWVMPAHDRDLKDFRGQTVDIDLASSALAWQMATCCYLLGDRLSPETRQLVRDNIRRRILAPYRDMFEGRRKPNWWMFTTNNWNAVCLACVTGTALILEDRPEDRAFFVAAAEVLIDNFLRGFTPDGYCSEGLGYWNYGFGHFVLLAETVRQATGGQLDLFARTAAAAPARFADAVEIVNGVYPAFADCSVDARPSARLERYIRARTDPAANAHRTPDTVAPGGLFESMMYSFPGDWAGARLPAASAPATDVMRTWFKDAGVLICRPREGTAGRFGAALKGGHNDEHHNHNDAGTYVVVVGREPVLLDPGAEVYTARTFSGKRYESRVLNSYGHPVPVIGGQFQQTGRKARAAILRADFTDAADTLAMDLLSAYRVPGLKRMERTFVYSRDAVGSLTVADRMEADPPLTFETALITLGRWERNGPGSVRIESGPSAVNVQFDTGGLAFDLKAETIDEDVRTPSKPTRIGIALKAPARDARVVLTITPIRP